MTPQETRVACAERMGWTKIHEVKGAAGQFFTKGTSPDWKIYEMIPLFDDDMDASLKLCEHLRAKGCSVTMEREAGESEWTVTVRDADGRHEARDPSLSMAICRVFLAATTEAR